MVNVSISFEVTRHRIELDAVVILYAYGNWTLTEHSKLMCIIQAGMGISLKAVGMIGGFNCFDTVCIADHDYLSLPLSHLGWLKRSFCWTRIARPCWTELRSRADRQGETFMLIHTPQVFIICSPKRMADTNQVPVLWNWIVCATKLLFLRESHEHNIFCCDTHIHTRTHTTFWGLFNMLLFH